MSNETTDTAVVVNSTDPNNVVRERAEDGTFKAKESVSENVTQQEGETGQDKTASEASSQTEAAGKKPNRTGEFIDRIKGENRELRQRLADLESRFPKQEAPKAPEPDSFYADPIKFMQQREEFLKHDLRATWESEQAQARQREQEQATIQNFQTRAREFAERTPDFEEVINSVPPDLLPTPVANAIMGHERSPELAYHLGKNLGELIRLATLPPQYISYAIEDLASRLTATHSEAPNPAAVIPAKAVTRAPAPVKTLSGSPAVSKSSALATNQKDYEQRRRAERKAKGYRD